MKERVVELDYLKCILILLMVLFHLAYFSEKYPLLKQFVYAFHMPVFLILSGYLTNINKGTKKNPGNFMALHSIFINGSELCGYSISLTYSRTF